MITKYLKEICGLNRIQYLFFKENNTQLFLALRFAGKNTIGLKQTLTAI